MVIRPLFAQATTEGHPLFFSVGGFSFFLSLHLSYAPVISPIKQEAQNTVRIERERLLLHSAYYDQRPPEPAVIVPCILWALMTTCVVASSQAPKTHTHRKKMVNNCHPF